MNVLITKEETDQLKGIAILMILIQHISQSFGIQIANPLGPIGVCLFLFLSGYGLTYSFLKSGRVGYVSKRLLKVYLPYLLTLLMFLVYRWVSSQQSVDIVHIVRYALLIDYIQGSYWYLAMILYWYIAFYCLTFVFKQRNLLFLLSFICSVFIVLLMHGNRLFVWQFFSFPAGIFCQLYHQRVVDWMKKALKVYIIIIMAVLVLGCTVLKKHPYVEAHELGAIDTVLQMIITIDATIIILLINQLMKNISVYCVASAFVGSISYELYLAHTLPLDNLNGTMKNLLIYCGIVAVVFLILLVERTLQNKLLQRKKA